MDLLLEIDLQIAQHGLHEILDVDEYYIADGGYKLLGIVLNPDTAFTQAENDYMQICRTRHETINTRFKKFAIIDNTFDRAVEKHGLFTHAVANIVQVGIMFGEMAPFAVYEEERQRGHGIVGNGLLRDPLLALESSL